MNGNWLLRSGKERENKGCTMYSEVLREFFLSNLKESLDKFVFYVTLIGVTLIGVIRNKLWKILFTMGLL